MTRETLGGFVPAIVTPFSEDGTILEDAFLAIVDHMIDCGARGICVAGDNGESWALDGGERERLTRIAVDRSAGRAPVMMGATAPSARQTIAYAQIARDAGAEAVLVMPQTYVMKATRDELLRRFEALAASVDIPIVAYNSPRRAVIDLSVDDIEALLDVAPIIGIKESSRDFFKHSHLLNRLKHRLAVMVGPSHYILPGIALGAAGFIATGPELLGREAGAIMEIGRGAPDAAYEQLHHRLTVIYQTLMGTGTWPSSLKAALSMIGLPAGFPREPILPLGEQEAAKLRATLGALDLLPDQERR
ncbi:MAG: dihydrodipicolinate synthase family protein [Salinarimonadaceae bacterium]|nr:MAG: dihydrodipicolinate synthase family protein [Salinarimonadaceae bacterium]